MTEPVNIMTFGNAKMDANRVASKRTVQQNGETYYVVNFKNGAQIKYPKQDPGNNSRIDLGYGEAKAYASDYSPQYRNNKDRFNYLYNKAANCSYLDREEGVLVENADKYTITQFYGLEFTGTKKPEEVLLAGCTSCNVDVRGGNSYTNDSVIIRSTNAFKSQKNKVKVDANDDINDNDARTIWRTAGTHYEGESRGMLR